MDIRTDFADEMTIDKNEEYIKKSKKKKYCNITTIEILKDKNRYNKEKGKYISIDFDGLYDKKIKECVIKELTSQLHELFTISKEDKVLIVGLGNQKIIADSLGVNVADKIIVTNHLFKLYPKNIDKSLKRVCVFTPKVMGQTGLESADLVEAISKIYKPTITILIDALASSSIKRINKAIQISDTGISPGSGVGNYRKEINSKLLNCKVISIGVATVVEAKSIVNEISSDIHVDNNENYNLILTPKEIDEDIENLSFVIAESINQFVQENLNNI